VITWFCPDCFAEVDPDVDLCPACGASTHVDGRTYEQKLIRALDHRLPDRRRLAARVLGMIRSRAAVSKLVHAATDPSDPYVAAEAARSLALIQPDHPLVRQLREDGSVLMRAALREVSPWPEDIRSTS
jgi:hypothetical protein